MASARNELELKIRKGEWIQSLAISHVNRFYQYEFIEENEKDELLAIITSVFNS